MSRPRASRRPTGGPTPKSAFCGETYLVAIEWTSRGAVRLPPYCAIISAFINMHEHIYREIKITGIAARILSKLRRLSETSAFAD